MIKNIPILSLVFCSIIIAIIWRVEIEFHDWKGLSWLRYFHWSIPVGFLLFLLWLNQVLIVKSKVLFNALFIVLSFLFFSLLKCLVEPLCIRGIASNEVLFSSFSIGVTFILLVSFYFIYKQIKSSIVISRILYLPVFVLLSIPFSIYFLKTVNHVGSPDFIHSIKSGFIIPFWCCSIGYLFLPEKKKRLPK